MQINQIPNECTVEYDGDICVAVIDGKRFALSVDESDKSEQILDEVEDFESIWSCNIRTCFSSGNDSRVRAERIMTAMLAVAIIDTNGRTGVDGKKQFELCGILASELCLCSSQDLTKSFNEHIDLKMALGTFLLAIYNGKKKRRAKKK